MPGPELVALRRRALRRLLRVAWTIAALGVVACTHPVFVRAPILYPAAVPLRTFPTLFIAGGTLPEGDLGERLRAHLEEDKQHTAVRVDVKELEPMRAAGKFPAFSLVVLVEPGIYDAAASQQDPSMQCDFWYGCQNGYDVMPELAGVVKLTVYEGPTAAVLQTTELEASVSGANTPATRSQLVDALGRKLERAVDVLQSETQIELEPVPKHPIVSEALARIRRGEWAEGRSLLETAAQQLGGLTKRVQARIWYDLAIARWYAPGPAGLTQAAYDAAKRALTLALRLDGTDRYQRTLEGLERARERARVLDEQRAAARHNYALKAAMPAPP
ncbi:MAG: hypothetical protein JWN48_667 [Myxococcaceae bacterium]|nr:hypothetical protein [Myxococcaceae bacterium]